MVVFRIIIGVLVCVLLMVVIVFLVFATITLISENIDEWKNNRNFKRLGRRNK